MCARRQIDWAACAARVATAIPRERLHPRVLAWAHGSPPRERWAVAFSGGADSLLLLLLLWAHWPDRRDRIVALHFNHRLRGAAANADERFCQRVCSAFGVKIAVGRWADAPAKASEAEARAARQAFFSEQLARMRARAIWLGHQQDDVAETLLMRLARGSGTAGLAAPRPVQQMPRGRVHLRPLLTLSKAEIAKTLEACGATWREDASNAGRDYFRTRVRRDVIPAWRAAAGERDAIAGAALARELIEEDDEALSAWVDQIAPVRPDGSLSLRRLRGKPRAVVRRALHLWFARQGKALTVSRQCFAALLQSVMARRITRHSIGSGCFAEVGKSRLVLREVRQKDGG
jgi:tRNA(Ile)-lysidine synthase